MGRFAPLPLGCRKHLHLARPMRLTHEAPLGQEVADQQAPFGAVRFAAVRTSGGSFSIGLSVAAVIAVLTRV